MSKENQLLKKGQIRVDVGGGSYVFDVKALLNGKAEDFSIEHVRDGLYSILSGGRSISAVVDESDPNRPIFTVGDSTWVFQLVDHRLQLLEAYGAQEDNDVHDSQIRAPMPGLVLKVKVKSGSVVSRNDPLVVLEAMKMENEIRAPGDGIVAAVYVTPGEAVSKNAPLIELTPLAPTT